MATFHLDASLPEQLWLEGSGLSRLMSEGEKDMPPGAKLMSDAGAESPLHGPFTSPIRDEIASPPVGPKCLESQLPGAQCINEGRRSNRSGSAGYSQGGLGNPGWR